MSMSFHISCAAAAAAIALGGASSVQAVSLVIDPDSGAATTIVDNGVGDNDARIGVISASGVFGGYDLNNLTVVSKPLLSGFPGLQFTALSLNSTIADPGEITFLAGDTDFVFPSDPFIPGIGFTQAGVFAIGGTTQGAGAAFSEIQLDNVIDDVVRAAFVIDSVSFDSAGTPTGTASFSELSTKGFFFEFDKPFAIRTSVTIDHDRAGAVTSISATTNVVPVPPALPLLASALGLTAWAARRHRR